MLGLVVKHGFMKTEDVLPAAAVQTLGRDAVVSRSSADIVPGREWRARHGDMERARDGHH
jgi:hypothetical protein